jgi:hypothetical protein
MEKVRNNVTSDNKSSLTSFRTYQQNAVMLGGNIQISLNVNVITKYTTCTWQFLRLSNWRNPPSIRPTQTPSAYSSTHTHTHTHIYMSSTSLFPQRRQALQMLAQSYRWWRRAPRVLVVSVPHYASRRATCPTSLSTALYFCPAHRGKFGKSSQCA